MTQLAILTMTQQAGPAGAIRRLVGDRHVPPAGHVPPAKGDTVSINGARELEGLLFLRAFELQQRFTKPLQTALEIAFGPVLLFADVIFVEVGERWWIDRRR